VTSGGGDYNFFNLGQNKSPPDVHSIAVMTQSLMSKPWHNNQICIYVLQLCDKKMVIFKFNYWTLCVKIGKYDMSKLNVNNLQGYWTVTEKSRFKTKSLWRKVWITDSQQISDFLVIKITQKYAVLPEQK
jgi:hypothetical protein